MNNIVFDSVSKLCLNSSLYNVLPCQNLQILPGTRSKSFRYITKSLDAFPEDKSF